MRCSEGRRFGRLRPVKPSNCHSQRPTLKLRATPFSRSPPSWVWLRTRPCLLAVRRVSLRLRCSSRPSAHKAQLQCPADAARAPGLMPSRPCRPPLNGPDHPSITSLLYDGLSKGSFEEPDNIDLAGEMATWAPGALKASNLASRNRPSSAWMWFSRPVEAGFADPLT
jgi:hypothetical protein